jgi:hypothetical protein
VKIGDTFPFPNPDRAAIEQSNRRRGQLQRAAASGATNVFANQAAKILVGLAENDHRANCPLEQAKAHLRRRGWNVFSAAVLDGPVDRFVVGTRPRPMTKRQLLAFAARYGWRRG